MRELRGIRNRRFKKRRHLLSRPLLSILVVGMVVIIVIIFAWSKVKTRPSTSDLTPGKIYTKEYKQEHPNTPPEGDGTSVPGGSKGEPPVNPESFTFYKVLNSKDGDIVPLSKDIPRPVKKEEGEIKNPQDEKISQFEKEIDKNIEKKVKREDVYTVQIAAFSNESAANEVVSRLKLQRYTPYLVKEDDKKGGRLYKIRVGRFPSTGDAIEVARVLKKGGYETYVIKAE